MTSSRGSWIPFTIGLLLPACGLPSAKPKAASSLACSEDQITVDDGPGMVVIVAGCRKKDVLRFESSNGTWASLRERAAFEMSCGAGQLDVSILSSDTYGITGCDKKVVYKSVPYIGFMAETAQQTGPGDGKPGH